MAARLVLQTGRVHQVLFNEQSRRTCALGLDQRRCDYSTIGKGGWRRYIYASKTSENVYYINKSSTVLTFNSFGTSSPISIPYSLHEFGLAPLEGIKDTYGGRDHDFSYWPGLSLNPGLWDLKIVNEKMKLFLNRKKNECKNENFNLFSENEILFEQQFSVIAHAAGLNMGYLGALLFEHIGYTYIYLSIYLYKCAHICIDNINTNMYIYIYLYIYT
jgi:hypothetical protein